MTVALTAPAAEAFYVVGSTQRTNPDTDVCGFEATLATVRPCTVAQRGLAFGRVSPAGLTAPIDGVVTRWSVEIGEASPATTSVKAQLRSLKLRKAGAAGALVDLPLPAPGTLSHYSFTEKMPVLAGDEIGLTLQVGSDGSGPAGAPVAATVSDFGEIEFWDSALLPGSTGIPESRTSTELTLQAVVEPDADRDGLGDATQDPCPNISGRQACPPVDSIAPNVAVGYERLQAFVRRGRIVLRVRSTDRGTVSAGGMLFAAGNGGAYYQLRTTSRESRPNREVKLTLRIPPRALRAASAAQREDRKVVAQLRVRAADAAGNESSIPVSVKAKGRPPAWR